jgi:hypothetical protein
MKKTKGSQILLPRIATHGVSDISFLVRQLKHNNFICNTLNCLNEENKRFSNSLSLSLSNFLFIFSCFNYIYICAKFWLRVCRIVTRDVLDVSLLVKQLKRRSFVYNALNCLNEENKRFSNSLSVPKR